MKIYTIHDTVGLYYLPPFTARNDGLASRMMIASLGDSFPHRADFNLYLVGQFFDESGEVASQVPQLVLRGASIADSLDPRPQALLEGVGK